MSRIVDISIGEIEVIALRDGEAALPDGRALAFRRRPGQQAHPRRPSTHTRDSHDATA